MKPATLFGMETEFGIVALDREGARVDIAAIHRMLSHASEHYPSLSGGSARIFLPNGACIYQDGGHIEYCTPECLSPAELAKYATAGELLVTKLAADVARSPEFHSIRLYRHCVDYFSPHNSWGCHESYNYRRSGMLISVQLLPFLCSRVVLTGCGGLNVNSPGYEFEISPRTAYLQMPVSSNSTCERGIFHTKNETLSGNRYRRLHVISGEGLHSQYQTALKFGTLALVLAALDHGELPGYGLALQDPVTAIRRFSSDPACQTKARLANGSWLTAIDIQRRYLAMVERHVGSSVLPEWAEAVCNDWRAALDALESNPELLGRKLDWPLKHRLFQQLTERNDKIDAGSIPEWNAFVRRLAEWRNQSIENQQSTNPVRDLSAATVRQYQSQRGRGSRKLRTWLRDLDASGLDLDGLDAFIELRYDLAALDVKLGELETGVFDSLDSAGLLDHRIVDQESCERGLSDPPDGGRARIRGQAIRRLSQEKTPKTRLYLCDWTHILGPDAQLDLRDPFIDQEVWTDIPRPRAARADLSNIEMLEPLSLED